MLEGNCRSKLVAQNSSDGRTHVRGRSAAGRDEHAGRIEAPIPEDDKVACQVPKQVSRKALDAARRPVGVGAPAENNHVGLLGLGGVEDFFVDPMRENGVRLHVDPVRLGVLAGRGQEILGLRVQFVDVSGPHL